MEYRELGRTGLRVSMLGFGCAMSAADYVAPIRTVCAPWPRHGSGINYFDTAPSYGNGQSEQNLGQVLREAKAEVYVGTKVRVPPEAFGDGAITRSVETSRQRLGRESVESSSCTTTSLVTASHRPPVSASRMCWAM
jgi:aryl-alcohol dehydrogenase-like predicted oxidoreductase